MSAGKAISEHTLDGSLADQIKLSDGGAATATLCNPVATCVHGCEAKRTTTRTQLHTNPSKREGRQSRILKCVVAHCRVYAYMHASHTFGCNQKG